MNKIHIVLIMVLLISAAGCKDPYEAELRESDKSLLVVEGFLNKGATTTFRLSRSIKLSDRASIKPELRARLTVEGRDNSTAILAERGNGTYESNLTNLQVGKDYRLRILTMDGSEYLSDFVTVKSNPAIDSVSWKETTEGVRIFVSTHDPAKNTQYYRWDYEETWEVRSYFFSSWKVATPTTVVRRTMPDDDISMCWKSVSSAGIHLGSSAKLASDMISEYPLILIPTLHEKLNHRYSVLVKQYALSKEAYEYLEIMRKNSETLGSIFDPQPSEVTGNIHSVSDPEEQVIGYITATEVQEKRIFIAATQLPHWTYRQFCEINKVKNHPDSIRIFLGPHNVPFEAEVSLTDPNRVDYWIASTSDCVDCTSRGGITKKPSFW